MERTGLTCQDIDELAGVYVLDALEPAEMAMVSAHLERCPHPHPLFKELAQASTALPETVAPLDTPPAMKDRVMAAIAATPQVPDGAPAGAAGSLPPSVADPAQLPPTPSMAPPPPPPPSTLPGDGRVGWLDRLRGGGSGRVDGWALAGLAAGVLVIVMVGAGILGALRLSVDESGRLDLLRQAVAAAATGEANVALLAGTGSTEGAFGYAVFPDDEAGFIVVDGLTALPGDEAYQAWFLADGVPASAGLLAVDDNGLGTLTGLDPETGTEVIAVTVEERPGAQAPTSDPILAGELRAATASGGLLIRWVI